MAVKKSLNMTDRQWLEEYAKDMEYKFIIRSGEFPYRLIKGKDELKFKTQRDAKEHVMREMHRYMGDHTQIVDSHGNIIEDSPANIRKQKEAAAKKKR